MRHFITIVTLIFLTFSTNAQLSDADAFFKGTYDKSFVIKNKIKRVSVDIFIEGKQSTFYIFQFDKKGLLKKQTILDSLRKKINDYTFKYNKYGDQIERTNLSYDLGKTYKVNFLKIYKGSQLVSEKSSELNYVTNYFYNSEGKIIETRTPISSDTLNISKRISIYNYDSIGNLRTIQQVNVNSNGSTNIIETTTYFYDKNGKIVNINRNNAANNIINYDTKGFIKSKIVKMPEDLGGIDIVDNYSYNFWK